MAQSLHQVYGHIVFSTKSRLPLIHGEMEKDMYAYLGGIVRDLGASPVAINGMPDHVHLLIRTSKSIADMDFIRQVKGGSSKWLNERGEKGFRWQAGYGWFGVSARNLAQARSYVEQQKEHHKVLSFQDDFRQFLVRYGVEYDERYVWD